MPEHRSTRTRTGCWNCRRRRKKCDEERPTCRNCSQKGECCNWGIKVSFREENVVTLPSNHPSMKRKVPHDQNAQIKIHDITQEVIRDYWTDADPVECDGECSSTESPCSLGRPNPSHTLLLASSHAVDFHPESSDHPSTATPINPPTQARPAALGACSFTAIPNTESPGSAWSPHSYDTAQSVAGHLLALRQTDPIVSNTGQGDPSQIRPEQEVNCLSPIVGDDNVDDGIFIPGSSFLELHSLLRNHVFDTTLGTRSTVPVHGTTPESDVVYAGNGLRSPTFAEPDISHYNVHVSTSSPRFELDRRTEHELWKNWTDEVATWLDKFDSQCHFRTKLPLLAQEHEYLRLSILAVSARQLERKHATSSYSSLALYQEAIKQLVPCLQTRSTAVVASCVVLCVLEMMSCEPRMWRRHLDGCASLIQSLGINGFSGGMEQSLFWCFARMDLCGGLISSDRTLIPVLRWASGVSLSDDVELFLQGPSCDRHACYAVYLCAQVQNLLTENTSGADFLCRWNELFSLVDKWYDHRPPEFQPILDLAPSETEYAQPFPTILLSSAQAISGTQLYHTATLLMLQRKPPGASISPHSRSFLWHARRIIAISISNSHHGCWTNCVQPLWIAGQLMSHPAEHRAIVETYRLIEKETGWGTSWRIEDLKKYWGDL